jgi:carboxylesterase
MGDDLLIPGAEPFYFPGNRTGVLLTHGFTGAPFEMREMGQYLAARGFTVLGIRLAGHATQPRDLQRVRWSDWLANVEDGLNFLKQSTDQVFLVGLSLGAILSLVAASRWANLYPIQGVVSLSCVVKLPKDWRVPFIRPLSLLQPQTQQPPADWRNPNARENHICYHRYPTRAIAEVRDLMAVMRDSLNQVNVPVLLAQSRLDETAGSRALPYLQANLTSAHQSVLWLEKSGHTITREPERELLFSTVNQFIQTNIHS